MHIHENIAWVEKKKIKNLNAPKIDSKISFSKDDLKNVLENLNLQKNIINSNKTKLNNTIKQKEEKLKNYANINKKIELDFKENDKVNLGIKQINKMLIYKKNEMKRLIRSNSLPSTVENKNIQKIIQNNCDISHLLGSKTLGNLDKQISKDNTKYLE